MRIVAPESRALPDMTRVYGGFVELRAVDEGNWEACAAIRPAPGQDRFVAPVAFYLCMCHYEQTWQPLAIYAGADLVGFVMWAVDPEDGSHWIGGLVIDDDRQGEGNGRAAMAALLQRFREAGAVEAALSYEPENEPARALYASLGFRETDERADGETVARLALR
jgi:diamine N-acetyltransferase